MIKTEHWNSSGNGMCVLQALPAPQKNPVSAIIVEKQLQKSSAFDINTVCSNYLMHQATIFGAAKNFFGCASYNHWRPHCRTVTSGTLLCAQSFIMFPRCHQLSRLIGAKLPRMVPDCWWKNAGTTADNVSTTAVMCGWRRVKRLKAAAN